MKRLPVILLLFCLFPGAYGEIRTVTINNAVEMALENNASLLQMKQDISIAEAQYNQAFAEFAVPGISASGTFSYQDPNTVKNNIADYQNYLSNNNVSVPGLGIVGIPVYETLKMTNVFPENYSGSINITKPVFAGFRYWNSLEIKRLNKELAEKKYQDKKNEVILNARTAFYNLFIQKENEALAEELNASLEKQMLSARKKLENGSISEYESVRSEVLYQNNQPVLLEAQNESKLAKLDLCTLLGVIHPDETEFVGKLDDFTNIVWEDRNEAEILEKVCSNSAALTELNYNLETQKLSRKITEAEKLPNLNAFFNYNLNYKREFSTNLDRNWVNDWETGLKLSIPIDNWLPFSKTAQTESEKDSEIKKTALRKEETVDLLRRDMVALLLQVKKSQKNIESQKKAMDQSGRGFDIAQKRFDAGSSSSLELTDAEVSYKQSRVNYLQAVYDYCTGVLKLKKMIGENAY